jgi:hypothetical protein
MLPRPGAAQPPFGYVTPNNTARVFIWEATHTSMNLDCPRSRLGTMRIFLP